MNDTSLVYVTFATHEEAARVASAVVEERLAACVNLHAPIRSFYWWEGKVQDEQEVAVVMKTQSTRVAELIDRVKALHSYDCPCVVALPIQAGNPAFLDWIRSETASGAR